MHLRPGHFRSAPRRTVLAVVAGAALTAAAVAVMVAPSDAESSATQSATHLAATAGLSGPAAAAAIQQCQDAQLQPVGSGWGVPVPSVWESNSLNCNLKYGDDPHRGQPFGDPGTAIRTLQRNLNYCYGSHLTVDGIYGSNTRAVVLQVQRKHHIAADGIYGPQTRSAMNWRMYHSAMNIWSQLCYSPL